MNTNLIRVGALMEALGVYSGSQRAFAEKHGLKIIGSKKHGKGQAILVTAEDADRAWRKIYGVSEREQLPDEGVASPAPDMASAFCEEWSRYVIRGYDHFKESQEREELVLQSLNRIVDELLQIRATVRDLTSAVGAATVATSAVAAGEARNRAAIDAVSEKVAGLIDATTKVCESGIKTRDDIVTVGVIAKAAFDEAKFVSDALAR